MPFVPAAPSREATQWLGPVSPLGVGFPYIAELPAELYRPDVLDFVEITAETLRRTRRDRECRLLILVPEKYERARRRRESADRGARGRTVDRLRDRLQ